MDFYSFWMILGISLASNLDNAGVGIAYGIRKIEISGAANLIIAFTSSLATLIGGLFGGWAATWISPLTAHLIGTIVIISVGIWVLSQPLLERRASKKSDTHNLVKQILRSPEQADLDQSKTISLKEAVILGFALSMNAIAGGFDAGITRLNVWIASLFVGILSYLLILICGYIGRHYAAEKLGDKASFLSGIILILIGLHQIF
jgi:putative sporulation protein YtaF